jgi:hypothetical protein
LMNRGRVELLTRVPSSGAQRTEAATSSYADYYLHHADSRARPIEVDRYLDLGESLIDKLESLKPWEDTIEEQQYDETLRSQQRSAVPRHVLYHAAYDDDNDEINSDIESLADGTIEQDRSRSSKHSSSGGVHGGGGRRTTSSNGNNRSESELDTGGKDESCNDSLLACMMDSSTSNNISKTSIFSNKEIVPRRRSHDEVQLLQMDGDSLKNKYKNNNKNNNSKNKKLMENSWTCLEFDFPDTSSSIKKTNGRNKAKRVGKVERSKSAGLETMRTTSNKPPRPRPVKNKVHSLVQP